MLTHTIMGGKVHVYKRDNSRFWQCSSFTTGKNRRMSTKEESLSLAKEFADSSGPLLKFHRRIQGE